MGWSAVRWRESAKRGYEAATSEGGVYLSWALKIAQTHAGSEVFVWDSLPMPAVKAIFRDCSRLTQYEEPFEVGDDALPALLPRNRTWAFLRDGIAADGCYATEGVSAESVRQQAQPQR